MIAFDGVHKAFGPKQVLRGFTLDVNDGETMVIIGFSGTGKSVAHVEREATQHLLRPECLVNPVEGDHPPLPCRRSVTAQ